MFNVLSIVMGCVSVKSALQSYRVLARAPVIPVSTKGLWNLGLLLFNLCIESNSYTCFHFVGFLLMLVSIFFGFEVGTNMSALREELIRFGKSALSAGVEANNTNSQAISSSLHGTA